MNHIEILANAFQFIEDNLQNEIKTQDVANACYCSKSVLEKLFRSVGNLGVHEYIIKRRMMLAARLITSEVEIGLLDIALLCGYSSNEAFTRAFKSVWNCNPSEFKSRKSFSELFPRLYPPAYKTGDLAILESMNRMEQEAGPEDIVFRIGGDEFVMLTHCEEEAYAKNICERIKSYNGQSICYEGQEIPLSLHVGYVKYNNNNLRYKDLFEQLHYAILETK